MRLYIKRRNGLAVKRCFTGLVYTNGGRLRKLVIGKFGRDCIVRRELMPIVIHDKSRHATV